MRVKKTVEMYLFKRRCSAKSDNDRWSNPEWWQTVHSRASRLALILFVTPIFAINASTITIPNFSFELPAQQNGFNNNGGNGNTTSIANWTIAAPAGNTNNGVFHPDAPGGFASSNPLPAPADQNQVAYLEPGTGNTSSITTSASLGAIAANMLYTLTVAVGNRNSPPLTFDTGLYTIDILANGVSVGESTLAGNTIPHGTFTNLSAIFTSPASGPLIGEALTIRLSATAGSNTDQGFFDNVRLTASAVPEPEAWIMTLSGIGMLFLWHRRRA